ncbi:MAG: DUF4252 domain-containing protein, partial [Bacteroidota bacterium]
LMLMSVQLGAQNSNIDFFFDKYQADEHFSRVNVSSRMFELFLELESDDPEEQALLETASKLKGLKVLMGKELNEAGQIFREFAKGPQSKMDELVTVSEPNQEFRFYISEEGGKISELVMVGFDNQQVMMMSLVGDINLKEIAALSKKMNIEGFDNFKNISK